jgi:hypothetical protein
MWAVKSHSGKSYWPKSRFEWPSGAANQLIWANSLPLQMAKWLASSFLFQNLRVVFGLCQSSFLIRPSKTECGKRCFHTLLWDRPGFFAVVGPKPP